LAKESNVQVTEMLNGCLCCVLVGQMKNALLEIQATQSPNRIIIETSGSAFPAPIAWQIREIKDQGFVLDSIITVVDCVNFKGYEDTSYTARLQAKYTDLILMNKHELVGVILLIWGANGRLVKGFSSKVSEREYDLVLDSVNELNTDTPKIKYDFKTGVSPDVVFGLDTKLFELELKDKDRESFQLEPRHHSKEIDIIQILDGGANQDSVMTVQELEAFLGSLSSEEVYRVKGLIQLKDEDEKEKLFILNWAFGRSSLTRVTRQLEKPVHTQLTVMGVDLRLFLDRFKDRFKNSAVELVEKD
jgi:G3E family GTPase